MKHLIACILVFFLSQFSNYSIAQNQSSVNCDELFFYVKKYWAKDSIGENGLRLLVSNMLKGCPSGTLKGKKWDKFQDLFGKPNRELFENNLKIFRYKLTNLGNPSFLDIRVNSNNDIVKLSFWEIDG